MYSDLSVFAAIFCWSRRYCVDVGRACGLNLALLLFFLSLFSSFFCSRFAPHPREGLQTSKSIAGRSVPAIWAPGLLTTIQRATSAGPVRTRTSAGTPRGGIPARWCGPGQSPNPSALSAGRRGATRRAATRPCPPRSNWSRSPAALPSPPRSTLAAVQPPRIAQDHQRPHRHSPGMVTCEFRTESRNPSNHPAHRRRTERVRSFRSAGKGPWICIQACLRLWSHRVRIGRDTLDALGAEVEPEQMPGILLLGARD